MIRQLRLHISDLHASASGIGHHADWGHIYVPFTFPGQEVSITLQEQIRPGKWLAALAGPRFAHCAVAGFCGGCIWPDAPYAAQLEWKKKLLLSAARNLPQITALPVTLHGNAGVTGYRGRIHLHASFYQGHFIFGLYRRGARDLIKIDDCPAAEEPIRQFIRQLVPAEYHPPQEEKFGFGIEVVHLPDEEGKVLVVLNSSIERRSALSPFADWLKRLTPWVYLAGEAGDVHVWERLPHMNLYTIPGAFQQANRLQSRVIRNLIGAEIARVKPVSLFDLYSGAGNYSLPFYRDVGTITGCDDSPRGIALANINTARNSIDNARYMLSDAAEADFLSGEGADLVIADPARQGMHPEVIRAVAGLRPRSFVYISCNTTAFVRDAKALIAAGLHPHRMHLVDFFPNTPHLNIVTFWESHCNSV
jgi:23S rRNA (uracil1939-C5)-methyltransferase